MKNIFIKTNNVYLDDPLKENPLIIQEYVSYVKLEGNCEIKIIIIKSDELIEIWTEHNNIIFVKENIKSFISKLHRIDYAFI